MRRNFWGEPVRSPRQLILTPHLESAFKVGANRIFHRFGVSDYDSRTLVEEIWTMAHSSSDELFEKSLYSLVSGHFDTAKIRCLLDERAADIVRQISPHLCGESLLDIGSGD